MNFIKTKLIKDKKNTILVYPDEGASKRYKKYSNTLKLLCVSASKTRDYSKKSVITEISIVTSKSFIKGKICILIDDMIDTGGTITKVAKLLEQKGAKDVIVLTTHGIFSNPAANRLNKCNIISRVVSTDSIDQTGIMKRCKKLEVVPIASFIVKASKDVI